jgi:NAD+ diphosphatase
MKSEYSHSEVFRFCPKCGSQNFKPETEKSLKCGSCGFIYFINMSASVAAIIRNQNNEVLFTVRKHNPAAGMLDLPGGFVDLGENAEKAIAREIHEELNLTINKMEFVGTFTNKYIYGDIEYQTLDLVFNCTVDSFSELQVADDVSGYIFRDPAKISYDEFGLESIKKIVEHITSRV